MKMVAEHKQPFPILRVEKIAKYLGADADKVRTALTNIQDGAYCVEVRPGRWVQVISIPVELMAGIAWAPAAKYPPPPPTPEPVAAVEKPVVDDRPFPLVFPSDRFEFKATKQEGK